MKKILIDDISLKNSCAYQTLSFKEKLDIFKALTNLNVDTISLSSISNDKADEVFIKTVCSYPTNVLVNLLCANSEEGIKKGYSLISNAKKKRLSLSFPISPVQIEYTENKKPKVLLENISALTSFAVSTCSNVEVNFTDFTRAENEFLYKAINLAIENGAKAISLSDISGALLPDEFATLISNLYQNVSKLKDIEVGIEVSDEMSFGIANIMSALSQGVNTIKACAINCVGYVNAEKLYSVLESVGANKGYNISINKTAVKSILSKISNNHSVKKEQLNINENAVKEVSANLSKSELSSLIKKLGYTLSLEDTEKVFSEYQRLSSKKNVNTKELDVIIATSSMQVPETYSLVSYSVNSSNLLTATASVTLSKNGKNISGLSFGNGSVDAAFLALENICGNHYEVDDFELGAVTEGKEAMGQAIVKLRKDGKIYSGSGVSTDIVGASIRAYISALNKIVYEEID